MEFHKTQRGKDKLYFKGYAYVLLNENKEDVRWRCYKHESEKCSGFLRTDSPKTKVLEQGEHVHPADSRQAQIFETIQNTKEEARPSQIFDENLEEAANFLHKHIPNEERKKRTTRNQRSADSLKTYSLTDFLIDGLETLPAELQRNFNLMRDLDSRAQDELKAVDKLTSEYLKNAHYLSAAEKTESMEKIQKIFRKAVAYGDDKVQLAMQTYEMVDKHIRRLDADLARFEADLKDKTLNPNLAEVDAAHKKKGRKTGEKEKKKGRRAASDDDEIPKSVRKKIKTQAVIQPEIGVLPASLTITHPSDVLDMPVDPNEPTYCFCHQVSYGEMIGCDNPDCPIEWFHFACVGLTSKPKGKWFCSNCSAERKKK